MFHQRCPFIWYYPSCKSNNWSNFYCSQKQPNVVSLSNRLEHHVQTLRSCYENACHVSYSPWYGQSTFVTYLWWLAMQNGMVIVKDPMISSGLVDIHIWNIKNVPNVISYSSECISVCDRRLHTSHFLARKWCRVWCSDGFVLKLRQELRAIRLIFYFRKGNTVKLAPLR